MTSTDHKILVLGGIRSGKSALAERELAALMSASGRPGMYLATATAGDAEMAVRIQDHQDRRPADWGLIEAPLRLAEALQEQAGLDPAPCLLIDCMSLWLSNLLHAGEAVFEHERAEFLEALAGYPGPVVIVSNEVGLGIIGMDALTRRFADQLGWLNQALGDRCDRVLMSLAGQVLKLKDEL